MQRHVSTIVLAAVIAWLLPASVVTATEPDKWLRVDSQNFELVGNATETEIHGVAATLERFRASIKMLLNRPDATDPDRIRVMVFKDAASFRPFKPKLADGTPDDLAAGFFRPGDDISYIAVSIEGDKNKAYGTLFHEYSHFLVNRDFGDVAFPPWLNEGFAEYIETFRIAGDRAVEIGETRQPHLNVLRKSGLMPWDRFFSLDSFSLQQDGGHSRTVFYAQAWALIHFLLGRKAASPIALLRTLLKNASSDSEKGAFQKLDGLDIAQIDAGVRELLSPNSASLSRMRLSGKEVVVHGETVALSTAAANSYLGDLLYRLKDGSAEFYLTKALESEPGLGMANAALGLLRLRQRRFAEAKRLLEKAVEAEQQNHLAHFYYAYLLSRENMDEFGNISKLSPETVKKMRAGLNRAISLNPSFAESYRLIGIVALITGDDLAEAFAAVERARELQPGNHEYSLLAARIRMRQEKVGDAKAIAERVFRVTASRNQRNEATEIIKLADEYVSAQSLLRTPQIRSSSARRLLILKRSDLTDAEVAKIDEEREVNNLNTLIERPSGTERQVLGRIDRILCPDDRIVYRLQTDSGILRLTGKSFDDLRLRILTQGTRSFVFRCNAQLAAELVVAIYRPAPLQHSDGGLVSLAFVPEIFRLKTLDQVAQEPTIIVEGRTSSNLDENLKSAIAERAEMERIFRETQLNEIAERLRPPAATEKRLIGVVEKMGCANGKYQLSVRSGGSLLIFETPFSDKIDVRSFTPDTGILEFDCRLTPPSVPAVFTYREPDGKSGRFHLVAIEFVPESFRLP